MGTDLNLENLTPEEVEFKKAVEAGGIPTSEEALVAEFETIVDEVGFSITNTSDISPFWRAIKALFVTPVQWLVAFLIRCIMPNNYLKTAKGYFLDIIVWGYALTRKPAQKAQGKLIFHRDSVGQELSIPAGTVIRTIAINGTIYRVIVDQTTNFEINSNSVEVDVTAEDVGAAYNLAGDYYTILESEVGGINSVQNADSWLTVAGADKEGDEELRLRAQNQFTAVGEWHTDAKYNAIIASQTGFRVDRIFILHYDGENIPRGPGSADAYIVFDVGTPTSSILEEVNDYIDAQGNHGHGDSIVVKAMPESSHDITVDIIPGVDLQGEELAETVISIEQFIRCAFRENTDYDGHVTKTMPYDRFAFSRLDQELHNFFSAIEAFDWDQEDIFSNLDIPRIQNLNISVNGE